MPDTIGSMNDAYVRAINTERSARDVTQSDLASSVGLDKATMNTYLTRNLNLRVKMSADLLEAIGQRLGMSFEELTREALRRRAPQERLRTE